MGLKKKIIIAGRAASGKTTLKNELVRQWGLVPEISYTTRPIRDGEVNGADYHFVSRAEFDQLINNGKMLEHVDFNGNLYGTTTEEFDRCDVLIMTPDGIKHIEHMRNKCFIISLYTPQVTIIDRLATRHKVTSKAQMATIWERINADNLQFYDFERSSKNYDVQVDSSMPIDMMLSQIKKYEQQYK